MLKVTEESEKRLKSELRTKSSPIIQLPEGIKLTTKSSFNMHGDGEDQIFLATLRLATPSSFDETGRSLENEFHWYKSNSACIMVECALIRVLHMCRKYGDDDYVSDNFFGLAVTRDDTVQQIDAEFKMKVWENLKFANRTLILDKDWIRPTFTEGRDLWGHLLKEPNVDLASEVTVSITIRR